MIITWQIAVSVVRLDRKTGQLTWKRRPKHMFSSVPEWKRWNARYAGTPALSSAHPRGYLQGSINGISVLAHRVVWMVSRRENPPEQIDHKNGDKTDNRPKNLRDGSNGVNAKNAKRRSDNTSGHTGIDRKGGKWRARIGAGGETYLGLFETLEDAQSARTSAMSNLGYSADHGKRV